MDARTEKNLQGVHPDLVKVVRRAGELAAAANLAFVVTQGLRTVAEQKKLVASGASRTMNSRHIPSTSKDGEWGHAVDLAAVVGGKVRWDWPLYARLAELMTNAAADVGVKGLQWGGTCFGDKFKDGPHFQLSWKLYP